MTSKPRKVIEDQFRNYNFGIDPLWKEVFDRTLVICQGVDRANMCYDVIMKMLYIDHKPRYSVIKAVGAELRKRNKNDSIKFDENKYYKYKRGMKDIAIYEAKKLKLL